MGRESWIDRMRREAAQDPREAAIREMIGSIVEVRDPVRVIPLKDVPEFSVGALIDGSVGEMVGQGTMGTTEHKPIRSDNAVACTLFLIKTPEAATTKYTLVHIWAGDFRMNLPGNKPEDIARLVNQESTAIAISGGASSSGIIGEARQLKYGGVTTKKHIEVPSKKSISVVYRPEQNDILIRIGDDQAATEVWEYEGF